MIFKLLNTIRLDRKVLDILNVLTPTEGLTVKRAKEIVANQQSNMHFTYVGYIDDEAVCMGSFIIMYKLGQNGGKSALIEDVAVRPDCQGKGYGKELIGFLCKQIKKYNVYKIILNCNDSNIEFYKKCGFFKAANQMRMDI